MTWPRGYKTCSMLNSAEHEISTAHKTNLPTDEEVYCFKSAVAFIMLINVKKPSIVDNIYEQDKLRGQLS